MSKTVDFHQIGVKNIEGQIERADVSKQLGNQLYMQGRNIEECELGSDIYHKGQVELSHEQEEMVRQIIRPWSYVLRTAIEETLEND